MSSVHSTQATATAAVKTRPFSIRIFLAEGSPTGLRLVEKSNWIGRGVVFPRSGYSDAKPREELGKSGVYVLVGPSELTGRERIYIGEGDPVRPRLDSHAAKKDFWTQAFIFTSKDENLNKAHVQYLEARLCQLAAAAKRAEIDNGNTPTLPSLSEADVAEIEGFLAEMLVCFPVLGLTAFESVPVRPRASKIYAIRSRGTDARGFETDDGFVVQMGSLIRLEEVESMPPSFSETRKQLLDAGVLTRNGEYLEMSQDYVFSSSSTAASVVMGRNANGRVEWKDEAGRTLRQVQESEA